jgi:hypothetical protein
MLEYVGICWNILEFTIFYHELTMFYRYQW